MHFVRESVRERVHIWMGKEWMSTSVREWMSDIFWILTFSDATEYRGRSRNDLKWVSKYLKYSF